MSQCKCSHRQSPTLPRPNKEKACFALPYVHMGIWKLQGMLQPGDPLHSDDSAVVWRKVLLQILAALGGCRIFCREACPVKWRMGWQLNAVLSGALSVTLNWTLSWRWMLRAMPLLPVVAELGATDSTLGTSACHVKTATIFLTSSLRSATMPACQANPHVRHLRSLILYATELPQP